MRVCFVHERFGTFGGAEGNVQQTATELKCRGHTVGVIHGSEDAGAEAALKGVFSFCFAMKRTNNRNRVRAALDDFNPDLIYVHKMADLEVVEALVDSEVPKVRMVHDHDIYCMRSYKYHYLSRKICLRPASFYCVFPCGGTIGRNHETGFPLKWISYKAKKREIELNQKFQRFVVYSEYTKNELIRNGFSEEKIEIHVPVRKSEAVKDESSFSDRNLIVFAGQIIRGKGVDVLLESLAMVKVPFECIILGEGNHRPYCEKLCQKLGLADRVTFKGFVEQTELKTYYQDCSIFVVSSVWPEPFGLSGPEAMYFGLPVIGFDAGGIKEWLVDGHNGYLVPWMDRAAYASRIEELLMNKELGRTMGKRGREWVRQRYDFGRYIADLEQMFTQVIVEAHHQ
ncbi:glycosyltransferase family 4 protein [Pedosphaera parvula]|uniref:Glycosyl transferase group 1 n=1 Tax=Pedosphaera parvula (strain Ellin514) TaxID=320771 RepID=B9X9T3_PEDPL|nr:glycosyltransferase family 4 protein [Pedosphaera parvula]EEF63234.1 glycosyl transferase group 1 [Pedosphaera parvula Ellin514]